jgi:hypothetical protein
VFFSAKAMFLSSMTCISPADVFAAAARVSFLGTK